MENPEGVLNLLDEFAKLKSKEIPNDLEEYLSYVATSGDPVYQWSLIKSLYRQKLINVITEFYEMCPIVEIPRCPNVDPFNYETMKNSLLKRLDSFSSAPFTIQRISELLTTPRKQYNRVDKFMRAIEKNIWVVSTREPGSREQSNNQETSTGLVNGMVNSPRVCVTVKHPKRVKSIEERIKSGHPQLIDDEEEEEEVNEYGHMEEETNTEILQNTGADESSLQCTSVKDLIEKYENGTIFSKAEEKSEFDEKSGHLEESPTMPPTTTDISSVTSNSSKAVTESVSHSSVFGMESNKETVGLSEALENSNSEIIQYSSEESSNEADFVPDSSALLLGQESEIKNDKLDIPEINSLAADSVSECESEPIISESSQLAANKNDEFAENIDSQPDNLEKTSVADSSSSSNDNNQLQPDLISHLESQAASDLATETKECF